MKNMELFEALGNMDDKYIVDARIKPMPVMVSAGEHSFSAFFKNAVSVAAIFLVLGAIFVWTLVGKDIINAYHGDDTTSDMTTTEPQTTSTPATTTDNGIVPPIPSTDTTTKPWHTTIPITTTVPPVTDITTTDPITTTQPPVTTTTTTPVTPPQPVTLSKEQLDEIQTFLNDSSNNGFVGVNRYNSPTEIQLSSIFRNSAGIQIEKEQWAEGEAEAVLKALEWSEFYSPLAKAPREAINALMLEKFGLPLSAWKTSPYGGYWYVEAYDAYYYTLGDDIRFPVITKSGQIDENGQYIINYAIFDGCFSDDMYTVTLSKTDTGYQFISNIDIDDDHNPYAIHEISADKLTVDGSKKTYTDQGITLSVPSDWLALEQHGEDGTTYFFEDPTTERCRLSFRVTGSVYAVYRTQAEYLKLFSGWGYENVNILSYTKEKISGYDCTKVVYSYTEDGNAYIGTRYDNVIRGLGMYEFSTVYPAAESERFAKVFESIMDSIVLKPD